MNKLKPQDRIIVALDAANADQALTIIDDIGDEISFYKIGLEILISGTLQKLLKKLNNKKIFIDAKLPNDIPITIERSVASVPKNTKFITLSGDVSDNTIIAAIKGNINNNNVQILYVPFLSSVKCTVSKLKDKVAFAWSYGINGFIISGNEISLLRKMYPTATLISPGIRPNWSISHDHKRFCTPKEAIDMGSDYIVIGRPIRDAINRKDAVKRIIEEIS